ncbi:DinB family protein [Jiangella endophytica]|uniref:DinB family protein n=1 Tax=Jiangella endophytica TaxID=1623398 RepID=UPI001300B285|nr:DinB family protein [Jiangella endophytica]
MTWSTDLLDQLEFYWTVHFRPRLAGLTDDEYRWEPVDGAWSLRPVGEGGALDLESVQPEPPLPPVTTIAWRAMHVGRDVLGKRARAFFDPAAADADMYDARHWPEPLPATAEGALTLLDEAYELWRSGVAALDDEAMLRPLGPRGGPYAEDSMAKLVLHVNREVMAHGAEICLLRDLYRAEADLRDDVVAAALRGDAAGVAAALGAGAPAVRATLTAEAAGLHHWDVVRALAAAGAPVDGALHYAAGAGALDVVKLLVSRGADVSAQDDRFHLDAAGWADFFQHPDVAAFLRAPAPE